MSKCTFHSDNRMFSLSCLFVALAVSYFGLQGRTLVIISSWSLLTFYFLLSFIKHHDAFYNVYRYKVVVTILI